MQIDPSHFRELAGFLGDTPHTTTTRHALFTARGAAWAIRRHGTFAAVIIEAQFVPGEPYAYGDDPEAITELTGLLPPWAALNIPSHMAPTLLPRLAHRHNRTFRLLEDLHFVLERPVEVPNDRRVRRLTLDVLDLLAGAPRELQGQDHGYAARLLAEGLAVAAIVEGRMVSIVYSYCRSGRNAEIGANTLAGFRNRGLATAAAGMLCRLIQANGQVPVWSCGAHNTPSRRIPEKLGFSPYASRMYAVPA